MIKVILVRLEGVDTVDELRLTAAEGLAELFDAHVSGLFVNALPAPVALAEVAATDVWGRMVAEARAAGEVTAAALSRRLAAMDRATELRRFDVMSQDVGRICARETRAADVFLTLRPSDNSDAEMPDVVETVLFRGGRHIFLINREQSFAQGFAHAVIAWNGSREAARALAEARPYLRKAQAVTVLVVDKAAAPEVWALIGEDAVAYLGHHGIAAKLQHVKKRKDVSETIMEEAGNLGADLLIMGGYGSSRLAEWLLGGTTHKMLRKAQVPLLIAH